MKKVLFGICLAFGALLFSACGSMGGGSNTPEGVAMEFAESLKSGDFDKLSDLIYAEGMTAEQKEQLVSLMKLGFSMGDSEDLKKVKEADYSVVNTEMAEDGNSAKVTVRATYNGVDDDDVLDLKKDADGNWKVAVEK